MLDINFLKAPYVYDEKYCIRSTERIFALSSDQYDELLDCIFYGIKSAKKVVDLTGVNKKATVNRNAEFIKNSDIYDKLLNVCEGNISNILHRLKRDEFGRMDVDRNAYSHKFKEFGKVVYIFDHCEKFDDNYEQHFYVKFNFANDDGEDRAIYLTSVHIPKYNIIKNRIVGFSTT